MHDPKSVAFEIYLGPKETRKGNYKSPFITIWHCDPEKNSLGCRSDDSCGWFSPPYTQEELNKVVKLAKDQYSQIFAKQVAEKENRSYADICYNQNAYGAIYWSWRSLKSMGKKGWQYGETLSMRELDSIYNLATNPVDNVQSSVSRITKEEHFVEFFLIVWRMYRRFNRKWYQHPKWHINHWEIQFHPFSRLQRFLRKCSICKKRFQNTTWHSDWYGTSKWCQKCEGHNIKSN